MGGESRKKALLTSNYSASRPRYSSPSLFSEPSQTLFQLNNRCGASLLTLLQVKQKVTNFWDASVQRNPPAGAPPPPVPSVSCTQFPQGCPCSASVIKASVAWLLPPHFSCPAATPCPGLEGPSAASRKDITSL